LSGARNDKEFDQIATLVSYLSLSREKVVLDLRSFDPFAVRQKKLKDRKLDCPLYPWLSVAPPHIGFVASHAFTSLIDLNCHAFRAEISTGKSEYGYSIPDGFISRDDIQAKRIVDENYEPYDVAKLGPLVMMVYEAPIQLTAEKMVVTFVNGLAYDRDLGNNLFSVVGNYSGNYELIGLRASDTVKKKCFVINFNLWGRKFMCRAMRTEQPADSFMNFRRFMAACEPGYCFRSLRKHDYEWRPDLNGLWWSAERKQLVKRNDKGSKIVKVAVNGYVGKHVNVVPVNYPIAAGMSSTFFGLMSSGSAIDHVAWMSVLGTKLVVMDNSDNTIPGLYDGEVWPVTFDDVIC